MQHLSVHAEDLSGLCTVLREHPCLERLVIKLRLPKNW